jgi:peptidyl-prolyl cis-trans isomerase SurA
VRQKIVTRRLRSRVTISKGEIDRLIENINNRNVAEKKIQQVFISYDKKEQARDAKKEIYKIYNQMKNSQENFAAFAKNYSGSSSFEKNVDDLGWFGRGELTATLDKALQKLNKGDISQPILTSNGWHILFVEDVREPEKFSTEPIDEYNLYKVSMKLDKTSNIREQKNNFEDMVKEFKTLGDAEEAMLRQQDNKNYMESGSLGWVTTQNLPPAVKEDIQDIDINDFSDIVESNGYLEVYHLGDKREVLPEKLQEYRNRIHGRLMSNRLDLAARRFMRDLRRQAYIEVRL